MRNSITTIISNKFTRITITAAAVCITSSGVAATKTEAPALPASLLPSAIETTACKREIQTELSTHEATGKWTEQAPSVTGGRTFRSPTKTFGKWVEIATAPSGQVTVYEVTGKSTISRAFDSKCASSAALASGMDFSSTHPDKTADWMTDEKLKKIMGDSKSGIIYVWSPEMVYSGKFLKSFREVAKEMKVEFIPLLDPRTSLTEMIKASNLYGFPPVRSKLNAVELYMRNPTIHYPSTLVFKNGKIHSMPIVGVMPPKDISFEVARRMTEL